MRNRPPEKVNEHTSRPTGLRVGMARHYGYPEQRLTYIIMARWGR